MDNYPTGLNMEPFIGEEKDSHFRDTRSVLVRQDEVDDSRVEYLRRPIVKEYDQHDR